MASVTANAARDPSKQEPFGPGDFFPALRPPPPEPPGDEEMERRLDLLATQVKD